MKNILILVTIYMFFSCELQREPFDSYTEEKILADKEGSINALINGCYAQLKGWSDNMHRVAEYPSDNVMIKGVSSDEFYTFYTYQHTTTNGRMYSFWVASYKIISQSSDLIKILTEGESAKIDQQIGELYYLRGIAYFYLCRTFGRPYYQSPETNLGVPIVNGMPANTNDLSNLPDRSSVQETYTQIINDLKKAETLMTIKRSAAYASKEAAQAMLSRVYLYMSGTYENPNKEYAQLSIDYANKVIGSGKHSLLSRENFMKLNRIAPDASEQTETIFAVKRLDSEYTGEDYQNVTFGSNYATIDGVGWGAIYASSKYLDLLNKGGYKKDARWVFIDPQYTKDKTGNKISAFRFIYDTFDKNNIQTGYNYMQQPIQSNLDGSLYITIASVKYNLTEVNVAENSYSIDYKGKVYVGEKDFMMDLNLGFPRFYVLKCSLQDNTSHLHSPIVSRLSEMYLNLAEAFAKIEDYEKARLNLNIVRERSIVGGGYTSLNSSNATQLIDEERQLEFAFEGHRSCDVYRKGQTMKRYYPGAHSAMVEYPPTDLRVVQFIPQNEINAYFPSTLTQNP